MWNKKQQEAITEKPEEEDYEESVKSDNNEKNESKKQTKIERILDFQKEQKGNFNFLNIFGPNGNEKGKKLLLQGGYTTQDISISKKSGLFSSLSERNLKERESKAKASNRQSLYIENEKQNEQISNEKVIKLLICIEKNKI